MRMFGFFQAYYKLAKEFHPDKNPDAGDKVIFLCCIYIHCVVHFWCHLMCVISFVICLYAAET